MIVLTNEEKQRFTAWLRQERETNDGLIVQLKKLPMTTEPMITNMMRHSFACHHLIKHLTEVEEQVIKNDRVLLDTMGTDRV